jgi:hypothetical protein
MKIPALVQNAHLREALKNFNQEFTEFVSGNSPLRTFSIPLSLHPDGFDI